MPDQRPPGLPPRTYLPIVSVFAAVFLGIVAYLIAQGFGVTGSVLSASGKPGASARQETGATNIEGGPPAAVMTQLRTLRARIAAHPKDDVALTQLADMYLTANKFSDAIPLYRRALAVNPSNVAAKAGLGEALAGLAQSKGN